MAINYQYCEKLRTIPKSKITFYKQKIINDCEQCSCGSIPCNKCNLRLKLLDRYIQANIPIDFWFKNVSEFQGDQNLLSIHNSVMNDIDLFYSNGGSYFFKGTHGVGKTFISTLLVKKFVEKGYSALYSNLFDIVNVIVHAPISDKFEANRELKMCDFLVIDEFDPRFFGSATSAELYGRVLESIIRVRLSNKLPTILITNNVDPIKNLGDDLSASMASLASLMKEVFVIGKDYRKVLKDSNV